MRSWSEAARLAAAEAWDSVWQPAALAGAAFARPLPLATRGGRGPRTRQLAPERAAARVRAELGVLRIEQQARRLVRAQGRRPAEEGIRSGLYKKGRGEADPHPLL